MRDPSNWTREHDRLIAERIERLTVDDQYLLPLYVVNRGPDVPFEHRYEMVASYSKDLLACYRAAETWRKAGLFRRWDIKSIVEMEEYAEVTFTEASNTVVIANGAIGEAANRDGVDVVEAFARALLQLAERNPK